MTPGFRSGFFKPNPWIRIRKKMDRIRNTGSDRVRPGFVRRGGGGVGGKGIFCLHFSLTSIHYLCYFPRLISLVYTFGIILFSLLVGRAGSRSRRSRSPVYRAPSTAFPTELRNIFFTLHEVVNIL